MTSKCALALSRIASAFLLPGVILTFFSIGAAQTKGTFRAGINYPAGPPTVSSNTGFLLGGILPTEVHIADFNGDGKPDVAVAAACSDPGGGSYGIPGCPASGAAIVVYLSNGDGTFKTGIINGGPISSLRSMIVGDFNGDGKPDVVAASDCLSTSDCSSGSIVVLLGNGDGTLSVAASYPLGGIVGQSNNLAVGDFNHDGKLDLAVGIECYNIPVNGCSSGAVEVFAGNGDGTLATPSVYTTVGNNPLYPVVGDFNGDGKLDIIAGSGMAPSDNFHSSLTVLLGAGDGTFSESIVPMSFAGLAGMTAVDLNTDGKLDLAITSNGGTIQVLNGNGDGTFQPPVSYPPGTGNSVTNGSPIVAADLNGDGKPDLIVSGTLDGFNGAAILLNNGTGGFNPSASYTAGGWQYAPIDVADFNGDGKKDLILVSGCPQYPLMDNNCPDGTLTVLLGNGDGTLRGATYLDTGAASGISASGLAVAAADFNGDGIQDLIYPACSTSDACASSGFALQLANGAGGYKAPVLFTAAVRGARFLTVGDFNGDGKPDVAVFNDSDLSATASSVSIFLNTGNGNFAAPVVYESGGSTPATITLGDFNGDGKLDIALLEYDSSSQGETGILLGNGDGTFHNVITAPTGGGNQALWLAAADFNGDGKKDLVVVERDTGQSDPSGGLAQVLLSNGDGTFSIGQVYGTGGQVGSACCGGNALSVATGDVNGDGKQDIVLGNLCEPWLRNQVAYDVACVNGSMGVLLGNGDGTFQLSFTQPVTDGNLFGISLADTNADGKLDAIGSTGTGIMVSLGNGDGTFQTPTIYAGLEVGQNVQMTIADLNGDGGPDIVQPGNNGQLAILYSQGFTFPIAALTPTSLNFANQVIGTTGVPKTVTLANAGTAALSIGSITTTGSFAIFSKTCGSTLAVGAKCTVKVTFTATALGKLTGTLTFSDNAPNRRQTVALSGTGIQPATLSPATATYATFAVGTTSPPKAFTLSNNQAVILNSIVISMAGDFAVSTTTCSTSLAAKAKCTINVTFKPTAKGKRTGQLGVSDNASNSPQVTPLSGTGK